MFRRLFLLVIALAIATGGVTGISTDTADADTGAGAAAVSAQGSVGQVAVTNAPIGTVARLLTAAGKTVATAKTDSAGAALFRGVQPGAGYVVRVGSASAHGIVVTTPTDTPPPTFYSSQTINEGYGYLKTRDGTLLSINVKLPGPAALGPYPTVIEYSGYDPSNPAGQQPASTIAQFLGYATVGVNLRGTGCSGGAWRYFETLQSLDGYDVVETIAAQPWVANGKVGMVGISYPGITQLFVAQTRPPHLAAIAPLSVIDDTHATLYPGGIPNDGFALGWAKDRSADAAPEGQKWAANRIANGDKVCEANQALRLQSPNVLGEIETQRYDGPQSDALAPATFVGRINVPVFLAGSWQDEQTGAHFADMLDDFAPGVPVKFTLMNGVHADALGPAVLARWAEFLDFYVARRIPTIPGNVRVLANGLLSQFYGPGVQLPPDRFTAYPDYASALAAYQHEPPVRVLVDVGAGGAPGAPIPAFELSFPSWPPPTTQATTWYLGPDGELVTSRPTEQQAGNAAAAVDSFTYDPAAFPRTVGTKAGGTSAVSSFVGAPSFDWKPVPKGAAATYVSTPLTADTMLLGTGSVDLWLRTSVPDVDLEVTVSEVRADGKEVYVQSGWLRASARAVDPASSTALLPVQTFAKKDAAPLPKNKATLVRVPIYPFGHEFAAGSRIRIVVQPPGGNRPAWAFDTVRYKSPPTVEIVRTKSNPSTVVLPVIPGAARPEPAYACDSLRGQPCRPYSAG